MLILWLFPSHETDCLCERAHFTYSSLLYRCCGSYITAEIFPAWRCNPNPFFNWLEVSLLSDMIFRPRGMKENSTKKLIQILSQHLNSVILPQQLENLALLQNRTNFLFTSFHLVSFCSFVGLHNDCHMYMSAFC